MKTKRALICLVALFGLLGLQSTSRIVTLSTLGNKSADFTTPVAEAVSTLGATIEIDFENLNLPDADDVLRLFIQTSYDDGVSFVDCETVHFDVNDTGTKPHIVVDIDHSLDGPATIKSITGTDPAAGLEISETVPANAVWVIHGAYSTLVTDVTATARQVHVIVDDGALPFFESVSASTQIQSLTESYSIGPHGITAAAVDGVHWIPLAPHLLLSAGDRIYTSTDNLQSGDDWGAPQLKIEEWHDASILTDGTLRDDVRSYNRPLGTHVRIKALLVGATPGDYFFVATVFFR